MSLFAENQWETDTTYDSLGAQLCLKPKRNKKHRIKKKLVKDSAASLPDNNETQKNEFLHKHSSKRKENLIENRKTAKLAKRSKAKKRERSLSNSVTLEEPSANTKSKAELKRSSNKNIASQDVVKKRKIVENSSQEESDKLNTKLFSSKINKVVKNKRSNRKLESEKGKPLEPIARHPSANQEGKSRRKRTKEKLKKLTAAQKTNGSITKNNDPKVNEEKSLFKNLDLQKLEKMLVMKEVKVNEKSKELKKPESLRERMISQLRASRFRFLNETLYNNESSESRKYFKEDPEAFEAYHSGYRHQVEQWPVNPLDVIIASIKKMSKDYIVADFGCGEGRLAESVTQKVHSFDLMAVNDKVKACDMAHTPLLTSSVNIVVFCLSLMGTNLADYIVEANRVLKANGILKIADVESRFENVDEFISLLESYGFTSTWKDLSHNLFYFMDFKKIREVNRNANNLPVISLKSCVYKKR